MLCNYSNMNPARSQEFNKNVVMVYSEEVGFSGYKSLEEKKLSNIETSISGVLDYSKLINSKMMVTGDLYTGIIVHQMDLNAVYDNIDIAGFAGADISGILEQLQDGVISKTNKSSSISNSTVGTSNGTVLGANKNRLELYVQNLADSPIYVKYGPNASSSSFNFLLAANTATNAGDGGTISDQGYTGIVSVSGVTTSRYISWERS